MPSSSIVDGSKKKINCEKQVEMYMSVGPVAES
jgi:hypothetical protein